MHAERTGTRAPKVYPLGEVQRRYDMRLKCGISVVNKFYCGRFTVNVIYCRQLIPSAFVSADWISYLAPFYATSYIPLPI